MSDENFNETNLTEKLSKLNSSQQSIESLSRWCISHRKRAKQVVETWEKLFKAAPNEQRVSFLYLSNDILQNSRRKGSEFVNEFWKVLPAALKIVYDSGHESCRKVAFRLVDIWEERKVFGSRGQNLKNEMLGKNPAPVNIVKTPNPIKVVKRDATSVRIKLAVGGLPEKILTALQLVHDEAVNEESAVGKFHQAISSVQEIEKDVRYASSRGNLNGSDVVDNLETQENMIKECINELEKAEAVRVALVSHLTEALQDQEKKLEQVRSEISVARSQIEQAANIKLQLKSNSSVLPKHNIEEKKRFFAEVNLELERTDAEIQAEGVYNQRLQNLALTIDKVRYVMRCVFGDPKNAPPPLERLSPEEAASFLWRGEGSLVEELVQCMAPHTEDVTLRDLKFKIDAHDPSGSDNPEMKLRKSLLWLRDEVRNLPCSYKSRHDAAADLIHLYAHTKCFFRIREYKKVTSPPVHITPLDLGPKSADKLGSGVHEYCKTYGETYCLGQLIFWHNQNAEPDAVLAKASRGCLSLPEVGSFYAKVQKPSRQRVYGPRMVKFMLSIMEKQPQKPWPKDRIWSFKSSLKFVGSPTLDAALNKGSIDREMVQWLRHRSPVYQAMWDR